jgi:alkylation response protein AidB-like acyl-CoA dehydrogenase
LAFYEFLVPLVKGFSTEMSLEVTSLGVQVHGGMGFIEETGAAAVLPRRENPDDLRRHHRHSSQRFGRDAKRPVTVAQTAKAIASQIEQTEKQLKAPQ